MDTIALPEQLILINAPLENGVVMKITLKSLTAIYAQEDIIVKHQDSHQWPHYAKKDFSVLLVQKNQDQNRAGAQRETIAQKVLMKKHHVQQVLICLISMEHFATIVQEATTVRKEQ